MYQLADKSTERAGSFYTDKAQLAQRINCR